MRSGALLAKNIPPFVVWCRVTVGLLRPSGGVRCFSQQVAQQRVALLADVSQPLARVPSNLTRRKPTLLPLAFERQRVTRAPAAFLAADKNPALNEVRDIALRGVLRRLRQLRPFRRRELALETIQQFI
jgi:hypothetical protein